MTGDSKYMAQLDRVADTVAGMGVTLKDAIDIYLFLVGDAVAMFTDREFNPELIDAVCKDLIMAYTINCDTNEDVNVH